MQGVGHTASAPSSSRHRDYHVNKKEKGCCGHRRRAFWKFMVKQGGREALAAGSLGGGRCRLFPLRCYLGCRGEKPLEAYEVKKRMTIVNSWPQPIPGLRVFTPAPSQRWWRAGSRLSPGSEACLPKERGRKCVCGDRRVVRMQLTHGGCSSAAFRSLPCLPPLRSAISLQERPGGRHRHYQALRVAGGRSRASARVTRQLLFLGLSLSH